MPRSPKDDDDTPSRPRGVLRTGWLERLFGGSSTSPDSPPREPMAPERIGRYRILHRLGQGGMGIVYAAEDPTLGRRVALKTIARPDEDSALRFRREARAAASVNHPHACQIFEIGEDEGRLFIAMELLEGEPLSERLERGPLALGEALSLGREMLSALAALHGQGIVHRDLKPSNVFLTPHGTKVLDFGLARPLLIDSRGPLAPESDLTRSGLIVGTPRYMAPEQVLGDPIDARTDVFTAGAVLFEALAGRHAFPGTSAVEIMHATLHEQPPALAGPPAVVAFDRVIRRALAKSPAERYPSAEAMSLDLADIVLASPGESAAPALALTRLVVLPFRVLRADPEIDFLGLALADAVSASLGRLGSIVVRSSAAGARFAGETPDLPAIASQLDVDLVLLGTLLRSGERLRVSTQLVQAKAGTMTWSHTTESEVGDVFRLQDDLAQAIVAALSPSLGPRAPERPGETPATARAYEFYLRGNEAAREMSHLPVARDLYLRCVAEDPRFAPAWANLGRAHRLIGKYLETSDLARHQGLAGEALRRALELSPRLPRAHKLYAQLEADLGRAQDAMVRLLRLAQESRNDPELFAGLVHTCRYSGLLEASLAAHREALRLDPHLSTGIVHAYWLRADFEQVLVHAGNEGLATRAFALLALGRQPEALAAWDEFARFLSPQTGDVRDWLHDAREFLLQSEGSRPAVVRSLRGVFDPEERFFVGTQAAQLGMPEAVTILGQAVDAGYAARDALLHHPWIAPVREEPGFAEVLRRAEESRERAVAAFREAGGEALLGLVLPGSSAAA